MKNKIIYGVIAALVAIGLWLYVVTVVNPEWEDTFHNIPVILENEEVLLERGLMLAADEDPTVTLKLSGNRTDMIKLNNGNITIRADLSRIYSAGEQSISYSIVYPGDVPSNAFEVLSQTPQQITLSVVERTAKPVSVELDVSAADPGYRAIIENAVLSFDKINVSGPAEVIDRVEKAKITIDLTGKKQTISQEFDYVLLDADGNPVESRWLKATPQKVHCTLPIHKVQNVTIAMNVLEGAGLKAGDYSITYIDQETNEPIRTPIMISGTEKQMSMLMSDGLLQGDKLFFDVPIDLSKEKGTPAEGGGLEIVVQDLSLDELLGNYEISNYSGVNKVTVVVKITGVALKTIRVKTIEQVGLASDATVELWTRYVEVILRGPSLELAMITEEDITVTVDFTGAAADGNNTTFKATVTVNKGEHTFAVGTYEVEAVVSPIAA